jgi:hypothetical protein
MAGFAIDPLVAASVRRRLGSQSVSQTARDHGVSARSVRRIRDGEHCTEAESGSTAMPRCCGCGALLVIAPCKACETRGLLLEAA